MNNIQNVSVTQTTSAVYAMRNDMFEEIYLQNITTKTIVAYNVLTGAKVTQMV